MHLARRCRSQRRGRNENEREIVRRVPASVLSQLRARSATWHHSSTWLLSGGWLVLARALDTLLAPAAGLGLRQGGKPFRLDRLVTELAGAVGTAVHTFERCGEAIDTARESLPFPRDGLQILALSGMRPCWLVGRWSGPHHSDLVDRSGPLPLEALSNLGLGILGHSCLQEGGR